MNLGIISRKPWAGFCMKEATGKMHKEVTAYKALPTLERKEQGLEAEGSAENVPEDPGVEKGFLSGATGDEW